MRAAKLVVVPPRSRRGLRVVLLRSPGGVLRVKPSGRSRVLALVNLSIDFDSAAWGQAVARAADTPWLDLGVAPRGTNRRGALRAYLTVMGRVRRQDRLAPTVPAGLALSERGQLSLRLAWRASRDNRAVSQYGLYRNGARVGSSKQPSASFTGLDCGRTYQLAVDASDATGNHSAKAQISATTTSCAPGDSPPPPGPQPPPAPPAPPAPPGQGGALPPALPPSAGATFYVAASGSNTNPGTEAQPWKTIQKALSTLTAGQRALVRAGTYAENLDMSRAGSPLAPITVQAYPGERPVLTAAGSHPLEVSSTGAYFRFSGFVIEKAPGTSGGNVDIYGHHVEISKNEVRLGTDQGVYTAEESHHAQILGNWIHDNGKGIAHQSHGIYLQGDDHLVANNVIHDHVEGFGIQVYDKGDRAIVTGNTITGAGHSGIVVGGSGGRQQRPGAQQRARVQQPVGHLQRLVLPDELGRRPQRHLRQLLRPDQGLRGPELRRRQPHDRSAFHQLRGPELPPARGQPGNRLRPGAVLARHRLRRQRPHVRIRPGRRRVRALLAPTDDWRRVARCGGEESGARLTNRVPMTFAVPPLRPSIR